MLASWDGFSLELWNETGVRQAVFEPVAEKTQPEINAEEDGATRQESIMHAVEPLDGWAALDLTGVQADVTVLMLPVENLLQRTFTLPVEHPRFVDAAILGQELDDQAGVDPSDWWLCWQTTRADKGVRGLVFALPQILKTQLSESEIGGHCPGIYPDIAVRLQACLPSEHESCAVLDSDSSGLMLGVVEAGVWRGMRRLNVDWNAEDSHDSAIDDALRSLRAMGFDCASMPVFGKLDGVLAEAFQAALPNIGDAWKVETNDGLASRHVANAAAFSSLQSDIPFNFRHGRWALQSDWKKRLAPWKRAVALAAVLMILLMGHDVYRVHQLSNQQLALRQGIEDVFHQALPGVAMLDPMLQLKQAAGGGADGDRWFFIKQLQAISQLQGKQTGLQIESIRYSGKDIILGGSVKDFAAANRVRDALSSILQRKVELLDTDLRGKQVRIRLRWS